MNRMRWGAGTITAIAVLALAACGGGSGKKANPLAPKANGSVTASASASTGSGGSSGGTIVVGSANFPENELLADIYADALKAKGEKVQTKLNIGSREVLYSQISSGGLDVLPEYNGALLFFLDKNATATQTDAVNAALKAKLPANLAILDSSSAEDKDSITVTKATADKYHLKAIGDLQPVAGQMVLGGPPEFKTRPQGVPGLQRVYNVVFKEFRALDEAGPVTVSALKNGQVQAANLFTTDPSIVANNFVVLDDPKHLFGAQNVTPLIYQPAVDSKGRDALNAVSAKLDTGTLATLVKQVVADKQDADKVAADWLKSAGLG